MALGMVRFIDAGAASCADADHEHDQRNQGEDHKDAGQRGGFGYPAVVQGGQREDPSDGDDPLHPGGSRDRVGGEGQCHGCTGGGLADHEPPSGGEPPPFAEAFSSVNVGSTGGWIDGGQLGGCSGVAVGDHRGDRQPDQQAGASHFRGWSKRGEHAGSDHRSQTDDYRVPGP